MQLFHHKWGFRCGSCIKVHLKEMFVTSKAIRQGSSAGAAAGGQAAHCHKLAFAFASMLHCHSIAIGSRTRSEEEGILQLNRSIKLIHYFYYFDLFILLICVDMFGNFHFLVRVTLVLLLLLLLLLLSLSLLLITHH